MLRCGGEIIYIFLEISFSFQEKTENRLRFDEVTTMSLVAPFLEHAVLYK